MIKIARNYAKAYRQYLAAYIGQSFTEGDADRQNLGMALDHLEEAAGLLLHLADALSRIEAETEARVLERAAQLCDASARMHAYISETAPFHKQEALNAKECEARSIAAAIRALSTKNLPTSPKSVEEKRPAKLPEGWLRIPILLDCPFCGADGETIDPHGWEDGDGRHGPQCLECGATAESYEKWNERASPDTDLSVSGEVIGGAIIATSVEVDFGKGTWTFESKGEWSVMAGDYYLIPVKK